MSKEDLIVILDLIKIQQERDMSGDNDNEAIWDATMRSLLPWFDKDARSDLDNWIFESECGRYPVFSLPFANNAEFAEYMSAKSVYI